VFLNPFYQDIEEDDASDYIKPPPLNLETLRTSTGGPVNTGGTLKAQPKVKSKG
jgi:hypothetical protein